MRRSDVYYKPSGKFSPLAPLWIGLIGVGGTTLLALIYGFVIFYCPLIYINAIIVMLYGGAVGLAAGLALYAGKVRNPPIRLLTGVCLAGFGIYLAWVFWIYAASEREVFAIFPWQVVAVALALAEEGSWSVRGVTPSGFGLMGIWAIEAAMIGGFAIVGSRAVIGSKPFCEDCGEWVDESRSISLLEPIMQPSLIREGLETGDFSQLMNLRKVAVGNKTYTNLELIFCEECKNLFFLTVNAITHVVEDDKEVQKEKAIIENLILDRSGFDKIRGLAKAPKIGQEDAPDLGVPIPD